MSSDLVTVHNQQENVYIQHRHNGERSWIGLNDRSVEGSFVWTNKEISSFRYWAPKQPNDWNNEDCVHTLGVKHGYTWNDVPCNNCFNFTCFTDFDECKTNTNNCDVNADCLNTVGSYTCTCKAGYTGNGKKCNAIDECSSNSHSCDVNAVCNKTYRSYTCTCKAGYSGDGQSCTDIDECVSGVHDCHSSASCTNTVGSYTCSCNHPYTGDGKNCTHSAPVVPLIFFALWLTSNNLQFRDQERTKAPLMPAKQFSRKLSHRRQQNLLHHRKRIQILRPNNLSQHLQPDFVQDVIAGKALSDPSMLAFRDPHHFLAGQLHNFHKTWLSIASQIDSDTP